MRTIINVRNAKLEGFKLKAISIFDFKEKFDGFSMTQKDILDNELDNIDLFDRKQNIQTVVFKDDKIEFIVF